MLLCTSPARADFSSCLGSLRQAAANAGVRQETISAATDGLTPNDAVSFMDKQPEFTTPVWDYVSGLADEERVEEGKTLLRKYASALNSAQARYGVDPATVVAVWGVESDFGKSFGKLLCYKYQQGFVSFHSIILFSFHQQALHLDLY